MTFSQTKVTQMGFGAGAIADYPWHLDGTKPWTEEDEIRAMKTLHALTYIPSGIVMIDTANRYGNGRSEEIIGRFLAGLPEIVRERFFIMTKISMDRSTLKMWERLKESEQRLGRKPNAVLLHNPDLGKHDDVDYACSWLTEDVRGMGVRFIGMSTEPERTVARYYRRHGLNVIEYPFSFADQRAHTEIFPWIQSGHWIMNVVNRVMGGPDANSKPNPYDCLQYVMAHRKYIDVVLVGTTNPSHVIECSEIIARLNNQEEA